MIHQNVALIVLRLVDNTIKLGIIPIGTVYLLLKIHIFHQMTL